MNRGFTLIEMLVSVAIFAVVMVVALGALLAMSAADRRAEALKSVINNLDSALDSMSRGLRTGTDWGCGSGGGIPPTPNTDCKSGGNAVVFTPAGAAAGTLVAYQFDTTGCANGIGCIERDTYTIASGGWSGWIPLTAPDVIITPGYLFDVLGTKEGSADNVQPKAEITISGYAVVTEGATSVSQCNTSGVQCAQFHVQTSVTQRLYDQ